MSRLSQLETLLVEAKLGNKATHIASDEWFNDYTFATSSSSMKMILNRFGSDFIQLVKIE